MKSIDWKKFENIDNTNEDFSDDAPFIDPSLDEIADVNAVEEDIEKKANGKWVNRGAEGEHGTFRTKKAARQQQKAMFANGYKG